jgi:hypothetical protein
MRIARGSSLLAFGLSFFCTFIRRAHAFILRALRMSVAAAAIPLLGGCATLITGTSQRVQFDSSPAGAEVLVNGVASGITPTTVAIHRDGETVVTFRKADYEPQAVPLPTRIEPSFWIDVVLLSPIGIAVDMSDRADLEFSQDNYVATLQQRRPGSEPVAQREKEIRDYIGGNYDAMGHEIGKLRGEHLDHLVDMLYVAVDGRPKTLKALQGIYYMNHSESAFADAVVMKFGLTATQPPTPRTLIESGNITEP